MATERPEHTAGSSTISRHLLSRRRPRLTVSNICPEDVPDEAHAILSSAEDRNRPQPDDTIETGDAPLFTGTESNQP